MELLKLQVDVQTPARQCHRCKVWVWLPTWWSHERKCAAVKVFE
ncbi:MAG: hypothetical protein RL375_2627 [Pseudomonadota bacterium]|jgi:hypothetical protein